jgi:hypothetical protein
VNTLTDPAHCGNCFTTCIGSARCVAGVCMP